MTAHEKQILYDFFKTTTDYWQGFRRDADQYEFADDAAIPTDTVVTHDDIAKNVGQCRLCGLGLTRTMSVVGEGVQADRTRVMVIGEAPGASEDKSGRPFVGPAGELLDKMLAAIRLSRDENCFITNVVKCRPPHNRNPAPDEIAACAPFLQQQIELYRPVIILVLGRIAAQALLQTEKGIGTLRGRFFDYYGIPLMPTYHPSALLRNNNLKRPAWADLQSFQKKLFELCGSDGL